MLFDFFEDRVRFKPLQATARAGENCSYTGAVEEKKIQGTNAVGIKGVNLRTRRDSVQSRCLVIEEEKRIKQ